MLDIAYDFAKEHPNVSAVMLATSFAIAVAFAIIDARQPEPPPPEPWTAEERDQIVRCVSAGSSAHWCAQQVVQLRVILQ